MDMYEYLLETTITDAINKCGRFQVSRLIGNKSVVLWCEPPKWNAEKKYKLHAEIGDWKHAILLTNFCQYSKPGTEKERTSFRKILAEKIDNSK